MGHIPQHVRVNHRRFHILVAEQLLHLADIDTIHQQMRRKTVTKCMNSGEFGNIGLADRFFYNILYCCIDDMIAPAFNGTRINRKVVHREKLLTCPLRASVGIFFAKGVGKMDVAMAVGKITFMQLFHVY